MKRKLFFTTPTDHKRGKAWPPLAAALERTARKALIAAGGHDVKLVVGNEPVFGPGLDSEEARLRVEEENLSLREVRIERWCTYDFYQTLSITFGSSVRRKERRALVRGLKKRVLKKETFIREHQGPYDIDSGDVYGYSIAVDHEDERGAIARLSGQFEPTCYLGERWLLQGNDEQIDTESYEVMQTFGPNWVFFHANNRDAEERLWQASTRGDGVIALFPDDEDLEDIARQLTEHRDLHILSQGAATATRVTIGRCRPDDGLVVVYHPVHTPELDQPLAFMV